MTSVPRAEGGETLARRASRRRRPSEDLTQRAIAWVEKSCAEQGVPVKLSDPLALAKIADILGEARDAREGARKSSRAA
jgi:hypothetical protein